MNVDGWKCLRNGIKCADKQKRWRKVWRFPYLPLPLHCIINKGIIMENLGTSLNPVGWRNLGWRCDWANPWWAFAYIKLAFKMTRIVLDTNCLLAILPSRSPYHSVWINLLNERLQLCVSNEILLEYEEILSLKASPLLADSIMKTLINKPNVLRIKPCWHFNLIQTDLDDNMFVDCAICGQAEVLISNDAHFNVLHQIGFPKVRLMKLQDFVALYSSM